MSEFLQKEILRKLYEILAHNPGLPSGKIAEILSLGVFEVESHLRVLEKQGILVVSKQKGYVQYYINERGVSAREKRTLDVRRHIYDLLLQNPGLHLSRIAELLEMSIPLADYHLLSMERSGELTAVKDTRGYFKRYYIRTGELSVSEAEILELLRKKVPLQVVLVLLRFPILQHKDILKHVKVASSTLSYYLELLVDQEIVVVQTQGSEKGYMLRDRKEMMRIIKKYEYHIEINLTLERFKSIWDDFNYQD